MEDLFLVSRTKETIFELATGTVPFAKADDPCIKKTRSRSLYVFFFFFFCFVFFFKIFLFSGEKFH